MSPEDFVAIPAGPFLLGADYAEVTAGLRQRDRELSLGLGAVLANTPGHWVDLPGFAIMPRLVTNRQYHAFWSAEHPSEPGRLLVDSAELWQFVWQPHALRQVKVAAGEPGAALIEDYGDCVDAIDALVMSYAWECQRLLTGHHVPASESGYDTLSRATVRVFAWLRRSLAKGMASEVRLTPGQESALDGADQPEAIGEDLALVLGTVEEKNRGAQRSPLIILLRRLARLLPAGEDAVRPSTLFLPLFWPEDPVKALRDGGGLFKAKVPFADLPVNGVSQYEALAFAAWLRLSFGDEHDITLPSEAEWEKAFGWELAGSGLDPLRKHVFPWQGHHDGDFNQWFSHEGERVEQLANRLPAWKRLIEDTARPLPGGAALEQGLGFGWQWTREPFNELERRYNRFSQASWPRRNDQGRTVYRWRDAVDRTARYVTVRGAPDQLGGPGTVTRRFALSPLRGTPDCTFRCVITTREGG